MEMTWAPVDQPAGSDWPTISASRPRAR